jgi:hypothetical protein
VIAAGAVKEGREAWRGDTCCAPLTVAAEAGSVVGSGCGDGCCDKKS